MPNLDLLRACAVLSVVLEHVLIAYKIYWIGYWEIRWVGVVGVFLFFVHTSLVLMWSLERKPHTLDFYIRRIFRLYPLALAVLAITLLFHAPVSSTLTDFFRFQPPKGVLDVVGAALLIPNIVGGYVPVGVMWTLPYEVEMYLCLPVIFFFVRSNFNRWTLLLLWVFVVAICRPLFRDTPHNFFLCIPYFLPGIMAYVGFRRTRPFLPAWTFPLALAVLWSVFLVRPGWRPADLLCLAVGLGLPFFHQITLKPLLRISHLIAKYSYGAYLVHPFSITLGLYFMPHQPLALQIAVILISLVVFSVAAYHLLEYPMIRLGSRLAKQASNRFEQHDINVARNAPTPELIA
ncbi:acyltransferase family protein [Acidisarcina polymorpha]|nr:acyltransferase [Acidisarcina polymorpha]